MGTIRGKLILFLVVCLAFMGGLTVIYYNNVSDLRRKVVLIERFDDIRDDLLEMRRYEKNFLLAGDKSSLDEIVYYLFRAEDASRELGPLIEDIMGPVKLEAFVNQLKGYKGDLQETITSKKSTIGKLDPAAIREKGQALIAFAEELIRIKRERIDRVLQHMLTIPLAFIGAFFVVIIMISRMTFKDILKPLSLLQRATEKATQGDFSPIPSSAEKADEVSQCVTAFNKMASEIQIRQEQLLQSKKMASIGTFTSGIAHELNNPINNISLIVEALIEDGETMDRSEEVHLYQDLMEQSDRASEIVKNLLEFSRTDQPHLEEVSLEKLVDKTARLLQNELKLENIKFSKNVRDGVQPVRVDKSRLQQAFLNLLINGVQAIHGGGEIHVDIGPSENLDEVRIDVSDSGAGISEEQLGSIFDPFFTTKKEGEGTGLGLALTYSIIEKHGGRIEVKSTLGKGTCFSIFLPLRGHDAPQPTH